MGCDKLTKAESVADIHTALGIRKNDIQSTIELSYEAVTEALMAGRTVKIGGFGTFEVRRRKGRTGRNPKTGKRVEVQTHGVAAFRPGRELKREVFELRE